MRVDGRRYYFLKLKGKGFHLVRLESEACCSGMTTVIYQVIPAGMDGFIHIEPGETSRTAGYNVSTTGKHDSGSGILFSKTGCDDSNDSLMPMLLVQDD